MDRETLAGQLRALGVRGGGVLLVHTSFRAVRPVEGGPPTLIAALRDALGPSGTLVMIAVERLRVQPLVFLCAPAERCEECDAARASVGGASRC